MVAAVMVLATGERARAFKSASPGMLPPLGILFALFVAFTAQQVWGDNDRASAAIDRRNCGMRLTGNSLTHVPRAPV